MSGQPGCGPPRTPRPHPPELVASPLVCALERRLRHGRRAALAEFWPMAARRGTPLVEPIDGDARHRAVTFLWRGQPSRFAAEREVLLLVNRLTERDDLERSLMRWLPGSDVWHLTYRMRADWRATYQLAPAVPSHGGPPRAVTGTAAGPLTDAMRSERWAPLLRNTRPDPFNQRRLPSSWGGAPFSVVELPEAPPQPGWTDTRPDAPSGRLSECRLTSRALGEKRRLWVYTPPGYRAASGPYPVAVMLDGDIWARVLALPRALDSLIADGRLPPLVVVLPESGRARRSVEFACHERFVTFLTDELLPHVHDRFAIAGDPARTVLAGQSLGGLAAAHAALRAPDRFGAVLCQSGSFWWGARPRADNAGGLDGEPGWLTQAYAAAPRRPIRFQLSVGLQEWKLLTPTRRLRDVLIDRGYPVDYREHNGGHDFLWWRGALTEGLCALLAGAPAASRQTTS
jgi:enterochelin esterase family protein